jgi:rod shape-determining protein MreB
MNKSSSITRSKSSHKSKSTQKARSRLKRLISHDIAIDLGTANTLISIEGKGVIINEPSIVATNKKTKQVIAIGEEAKQMLGRTPKDIQALQPMVDGVVSDYEVTEYMLKNFVELLHRNHRVLTHRPRIIIGLPCGVTEVEKRAVEEAARSAGARKVFLIQEPVAAAIGSGIDIMDEKGSMIVDIGGGTTEIAIIAGGRAIITKSIRIAGDEINAAIKQFVRDEYSLQIGDRTAEEVKHSVAVVGGDAKTRSMAVRGRNVVSGLPQEIEINSDMIKATVTKQLRPIIEAIKSVIDETPPELISDIMKDGIHIAGGGALITGIIRLIRAETHIEVNTPKNALTAVVEGAAIALANPLKYRRALIYTE